MVELFKHRRLSGEIVREYDLTGSAFGKRVKHVCATGFSREKDNQTLEEQELIRLHKGKQQL